MTSPDPAPRPAWREALAHLSRPVTEDAVGTARAALHFEARQLVRRPTDRWQRPTSRTIPAEPGTDAPVVLAVRPAVLGPSGRWKTSGISWSTVQHHVHRLSLSRAQTRWFHQVSALQRSTPVVLGDDPDRIILDDYESPLLWELLAGAGAAGIELVTGTAAGTVHLGGAAEVLLDARADSDGLTLETVVLFDGERHPPESVGRIGDHGLYAVHWSPAPRILLAPTATPLTPEQRSVLEHPLPPVPAADVREFLHEAYPSLRQAISVVSGDESVDFPQIAPPVLSLVVEHRPSASVELHWEWLYQVGPTRTRRATDLEPKPGEFSDLDAEAQRLALLGRDPLPGGLVAGVPTVLRGVDALEFVVETLPLLAGRGDLRIREVGTRPAFRAITDTPELTITAVPGEGSDWFDLGVLVRVDGRDIPFTPLFAALTRGAKKLLLVDRTYLPLDQPVFDRLRELIQDASTFPEWEAGVLRLNRYQAAVWDELDELADHTELDDAWRETVGGLLALTRGGDPMGDAPPHAASTTATLRPYQEHGRRWLHFLWRHRLGGVLADDMGLGKTVQTLSFIADAKAARDDSDSALPFLVVAPASVVSNWAAEAARFTPGLTVLVLDAGVRSAARLRDAVAGADLVVTSYALFRLDADHFATLDWAGLVLDEAQVVKNRQSQVHRRARDFPAPFKLAITGTPLENDLLELWALFAIVAPGLLPPAHRFTQHFARPIAAGEDVAGVRLETLRRRIRPLLLRRTKEQVAPELPARQDQVLTVELSPSHRRVYDAYLQRERQKVLALVDDLDRQRFNVLRSLTLLRRLSLDAALIDTSDDPHGEFDGIPSSKLDALLEQLADVIAEGHRALVFSQFTGYLAKAAARLTAAGIPHAMLDGTTRRRAEVIDGFRTGSAPVFLISLRAGGVGLNLTEADYVFLLDPWWNPAVEQQAVDRAHRIGQTAPVMVYRLVSAGTIEEKVMALKAEKARLFDAVLDGGAGFDAALTADDIRGLLA
ncbi:DNA helicase [Leifsonia sp. LS1]|uniref:DEAD/DEAH box helicase n=1 Tax=Leifsonia sp. LS1 TaxID=2828483 RepID=UPI001CFD8D59|nr:DEAD/DEAH box helicase [Leifsonia sp. LS1]GIT81664.1 DNA helicase [Leifsonia sp. LS1]